MIFSMRSFGRHVKLVGGGEPAIFLYHEFSIPSMVLKGFFLLGFRSSRVLMFMIVDDGESFAAGYNLLGFDNAVVWVEKLL